MTKITRQQITELIDRLGGLPDKVVGELGVYSAKIRQQRVIFIGTVLEKMTPIDKGSAEANVMILVELAAYWQPLGFTKSLQQIIEDSGWEDSRVCVNCGTVQEITHSGCMRCKKFKPTLTLESPEANALAELLISLFPAK